MFWPLFPTTERGSILNKLTTYNFQFQCFASINEHKYDEGKLNVTQSG